MPDPPPFEKKAAQRGIDPSLDMVQVPPLASFESVDTFYGTLFHELGHATGRAPIDRCG